MKESHFLQLFLSLLQEAIWRGQKTLPKKLTEEETAWLFNIAKQQAVSGLILDSLIRNNIIIPQRLVFEAIGVVEQVKQNSKRINNGVLQLHQLMIEANSQYVIVKGQPVATYYPDALLRQSGDVDYYCDAINFPKSENAIKKIWDIVPDSHDSDYHIHFDYHGVIYEGHFALVKLYNAKKERYWQQFLEDDKGATVTIDGIEIKTLSPTLHTLYVFLHLYSHLIKLGVGLRQFCDLAVMLHYVKNQIDHQQLQNYLKALGMEKAFRACGSILVDYLGLPEDDLGINLNNSDRRYGRKILDVVMYRGNMGHYNRYSGFTGWKHIIEASVIKFSHFVKFLPLAPDYSCRWMIHVLKNILI